MKMTCRIKTIYNGSQRKKRLSAVGGGVNFNLTLYYSDTFYITISDNYFMSLSSTYLH